MESPSPSVVFGLSSPPCVEEGGLAPPAWVWDLLGRDARRLAGAGGESSLDLVQGGGFGLASIRVPGVRGLGRAELQEAVAGAYRRLASALHRLHPVRWWNHIPGIHDPMGDGQDLYMVFNAGRYEALAAWLGKESFDTRVASASGVGHEGQDLVIHCLASDRPGRAVDNPRQIAPYRYSRSYGRLPPCFARATVIHPPSASGASNPLVLVGGTASIVGEASVHLGNLERQTDETLTNLAVLLCTAAGEPAIEAADRAAVLAGFRELRVYDPIPERRDELRALLQDAFPRVQQIEWVRAALCRRELLVEIEGLAELGCEVD